jgi:putative ABC transport system permease protein
VTAVTPVVLQTTVGLNGFEVLNGIDLPSFESIGGPLKYLEGGPFQGPDDMIIDDVYAHGSRLYLGSVVKALNHDFHVCGVIPHGRGSRRYVPIQTMQSLMESEGKASVFYVKLDDPENAGIAVQQFRSLLPNFNIISTREWLELMTADTIPGLSIVIKVVIGIAVIIGFIVIFQSMYTAVMERTREIGILKSLGASKLYIVRLVLRETLLLAIAGVLAGFALSIIGRFGILHKFPTLSVLPINLRWAIYSTLIALSGAMVGAIYPAFKAAQKDPIDALAYE